MTITRWRPQQGLTFRDAFQQLVEDAFTDRLPVATSSMFPVDIRETPDGIEIDASLPGAEPKDIDVMATNNTVTIKAEIHKRLEERKGTLLREEITDGTFQRAFTPPADVDANKITAKFENGLLKITLPKSEATKPKRVQIQSASGSVSEVKSGNGQQRTTETDKMAVGAR